MLNFYNYIPENLKISNDSFFKLVTLPKLLKNKSLYDKAAAIAGKVEGVKFLDGENMISKFNTTVTNIGNLSTGCKTILNIIFNEDVIFNISECGMNYLDYIYNLDSGNVYSNYLRSPLKSDNIKKQYKLYRRNKKSKIFNDLISLEEHYDE